jgi:hypothetical protein
VSNLMVISQRSAINPPKNIDKRITAKKIKIQ